MQIDGGATASVTGRGAPPQATSSQAAAAAYAAATAVPGAATDRKSASGSAAAAAAAAGSSSAPMDVEQPALTRSYSSEMKRFGDSKHAGLDDHKKLMEIREKELADQKRRETEQRAAEEKALQASMYWCSALCQ